MSYRRLDQSPPRERSYWELLPRRNLRRALFLVLALGGVLFIKHTGGLSFRRMFEDVAPPQTPGGFQHIEVRRPAAPAGHL
ncbi:MAG TPA: hypothetical protein VIK30_01060 [Polyangia bacterium]